jgi:hypothetical protein
MTRGIGHVIRKEVPPQGGGPYEDEQTSQTYLLYLSSGASRLQLVLHPCCAAASVIRHQL